MSRFITASAFFSRRSSGLSDASDGDVFPYKWMQRTESGERVIQSDSLNDVAESLRTTFARNW